MALILANILVSATKPRKSQEKGFTNPSNGIIETPEVMEKMQNLHENNMLVQGSVQATNRKVYLLNERVSALEKAVSSMIEKKIE